MEGKEHNLKKILVFKVFRRSKSYLNSFKRLLKEEFEKEGAETVEALVKFNYVPYWFRNSCVCNYSVICFNYTETKC